MMLNLNLPNKITLIRIVIIPLIVVFLVSETEKGSLIAAVLFGIGGFTDWLDGYLARTRNQVTTVGKLLDPIADKILVTAALIPLVELNRVSAWIAVVIIGREIAMSGFRSISSSKGIVIASSPLGKYKTGFEIAAIIFLMLDYKVLSLNFLFIGTVLIWIAMFMSIISAVGYMRKFWNTLELNMQV